MTWAESGWPNRTEGLEELLTHGLRPGSVVRRAGLELGQAGGHDWAGSREGEGAGQWPSSAGRWRHGRGPATSDEVRRGGKVRDEAMNSRSRGQAGRSSGQGRLRSCVRTAAARARCGARRAVDGPRGPGAVDQRQGGDVAARHWLEAAAGGDVGKWGSDKWRRRGGPARKTMEAAVGGAEFEGGWWRARLAQIWKEGSIYSK